MIVEEMIEAEGVEEGLLWAIGLEEALAEGGVGGRVVEPIEDGGHDVNLLGELGVGRGEGVIGVEEEEGDAEVASSALVVGIGGGVAGMVSSDDK